MRSIVKKAMRDEKGAALVLTLVLLLVGGLVIAPLLGFMGTGLIAGQVHEKRTGELYAADAGVEDAIWKIRNPDVAGLPPIPCGDSPWEVPFECEIFGVSGKEVQVYIEYRGGRIYRITSTATTDSNSSTTVVAYIETMVFDLFAGALVSSGDIDFHKDSVVTGDVYYVGTIDGDYTHIDGEEVQVPLDAFPTQEQNEVFAQQFKEEALVGGTYDENNGNMDISESQDLGPIHIPGNLVISKDVTINLEGVVYVNGYVDAAKALTIAGAGSIVAERDINLLKLANYTVTGDSIIMSLYGDITVKKSDPDHELSLEALIYAPNGSITFDKDVTVTGGVIGADIQLDKEGSFTYISKSSSFDFLTLVPYGSKIKSYSINQN